MVATTFTKISKTDTIKMDKNFDFSDFLKKPMVKAEEQAFTELNRIDDESYKLGILKTVIAAGNGMYDVIPSKYGFSIKSQGGDGSCLGAAYASLAEGCFVTENPAPKLPRKAVETVIEWYKRITAKNGEEAQVVFYWNQYKKDVITDDEGNEVALKDIPGVYFWTDEIFSYTPKQYNHGSLTEVAPEDEWYDIFNRQFGMYVETHSHNSMDAFASTTDEENSANDGFQLVFGKLDQQQLVMYSWMTMNKVMKLGMSVEELGKIMEFNPTNLYDTVNEKLIYETTDLIFDESLFEEWDKQILIRPVVTRTTYAAAPYTTGYVGTGTTGYFDDFYGYGRGYATGVSLDAQQRQMSGRTYTRQQETEAVEEEFEAALGLSEFHQALRHEAPFMSYDTVVDLVKNAFVEGYFAKKDGPYTLNDYTLAKFQTAIDTAVATIVEDLERAAHH